MLEGGFLPSDIVPRPPFEAHELRRGTYRLEHVPELGGQGERTVLGGLKAKDIDVVVSNAALGPCLAVSIKGTLNDEPVDAFVRYHDVMAQLTGCVSAAEGRVLGGEGLATSEESVA